MQVLSRIPGNKLSMKIVCTAQEVVIEILVYFDYNVLFVKMIMKSLWWGRYVGRSKNYSGQDPKLRIQTFQLEKKFEIIDINIFHYFVHTFKSRLMLLCKMISVEF